MYPNHVNALSKNTFFNQKIKVNWSIKTGLKPFDSRYSANLTHAYRNFSILTKHL
jgi:hypothetical protein